MNHLWVKGTEAGGRWALVQGKAIGDLSPVYQHSKTRMAQEPKEEAEPHHMFLILKVRDLPDYTCAERLLGGQKRSDAKRYYL